jgi:hypothetical protein
MYARLACGLLFETIDIVSKRKDSPFAGKMRVSSMPLGSPKRLNRAIALLGCLSKGFSQIA